MNADLSKLSERFKVRKSILEIVKKVDLRKLNSFQKRSGLQVTDFKAKFCAIFAQILKVRKSPSAFSKKVDLRKFSPLFKEAKLHLKIKGKSWLSMIINQKIQSSQIKMELEDHRHPRLRLIIRHKKY